jgi:two-component system alkaline phosphatase synthesis response regulator PhoP
MLTAKGTEYDTVRGLDAGADDYLAKPFGMMELISRVNALLRRVNEGAPRTSDVMVCGSLSLSVAEHSVVADGTAVALTLKEFDLLRTLMEHEGQVLSRNQLLSKVWGISYAGETRTVDVHIQTLRQKLGAAAPGAEAHINTVRGVGYRVREPNASQTRSSS